MHLRYLFALLSLVIVLVGCATGPADNPSNSAPSSSANTNLSPSDRVPRITVEELMKKINNGEDIIIVDTRTDVEEQFHLGHIPGALPVTLSKINAGQWAPSANKEIIFYCTCPNDRTAAVAAVEVSKKQFTDVKVLKDGYNAWKEAGYPIEMGDKLNS